MKIVLLGFTLLTVWCVGSRAVQKQNVVQHAPVRGHRFDDITPEDRENCPETEDNVPPNRVYTAERVAALRDAMKNSSLLPGTYNELHAYLIPYEDEHGSDPSEHDKRMQYISGFSGSNGFAWVTAHKAAVWTDGRYWAQADDEMDCDWILMKEGAEGYPTAVEWLNDELNSISNAKVGIDSRLVSIDTWEAYSDGLQNIELVDMLDHELIDVIWTVNRTAKPNNALYEHTFEYTDRTWPDKVAEIRGELTTKGAEVLVMHALDETAWIYNLRGSDRDTSPFYYSYAILKEDGDISCTDCNRLYVNNASGILDSDLRNHLNTKDDGTCPGPDNTQPCVNIQDYQNIMADIASLAGNTATDAIWLDPGASYAVYNAAHENGSDEMRIVDHSPVQLIKSIKNDVERTRYRECQIRDSAALIEFMAELEKDIKDGVKWTELEASHRVTAIRGQDPDYRMDSFHPISAIGANAAIIHYRPTELTDTPIDTSHIYLLDSGGNYLDGTTDVTRTFHFGTPKDVEKEAYTRVLMGAIDLEDTAWPEGLRGTDLDVRSRAYLYEVGLDFNHNTGHGIGYFLDVHEGPPSIGVHYNPDHSPLYEGHFLSDEPGFYREGTMDDGFGIRLETIVEVVEADTPYTFNDKKYLTFNAVTLVPFEPNLIDYEMLSPRQRKWLNAYNERCEQEVGTYLLDRNKQDAYDWLMARTGHIPDEPIYEDGGVGGATGITRHWMVVAVVAVASAVLVSAGGAY